MKCSVSGCEKKQYRHSYCSMHYARFKKHGDPLSGRLFNGVTNRYIDFVLLVAQPGSCIIWPFKRDPNGYARANKHDLVHRIICERVNGKAPPDQNNAAHSCGNGANGCINPHHLSWKSYAGNEADKLGHGTHNRGERHGIHKLTKDQVILIRAFADSGVLTNQQMAKMFDVSTTQISRIRNRKDWNWL